MKSMASNVFISPYHKIKNQSVFGKRLSKPAVVGFKLIEVEAAELNIPGSVNCADDYRLTPFLHLLHLFGPLFQKYLLYSITVNIFEIGG